jgi:polyisoprenoid-binding protein YceI
MSGIPIDPSRRDEARDAHHQFLQCFEHPMLKKQACGADASGSFNRADFGVNYGQQYGFKQDVLLRIQVEAVKGS